MQPKCDVHVQEHPPDRQGTLLQKLGETTIASDLATGSKRTAPEDSQRPAQEAAQEDVTRKQDASEGPGLITAFWESTGRTLVSMLVNCHLHRLSRRTSRVNRTPARGLASSLPSG